MLHVVLWKWEPGPGVERHYTHRHVNALAHALRANTSLPNMRVTCVTDDPSGIDCETFPLWRDCEQLKNASGAHLPSCYRRLKLYDWRTQSEMGMHKGDRVVSLDLDTLVTGPLDEIWRTKGKYVGWMMPALLKPSGVYNGSFQMFNAGDLRRVWEDFDPDTSPAVAAANGFRGSDQSWLSYKLVDQEGCTTVTYPTVASYPLHCRKLSIFSKRTRLVMFHGKRKPWHPEASQEASWIKRYWRPEHALSQ
jgi:hypothetical protein